MKLKSLFLGIMLSACYVSSYSVELLVSEDFSSAAWKAEVARLNPSYVQPTTNGGNFGLQSILPYTVNSHDYYLNGAIVINNGNTTGNMTNACQSFGTTGIVHNDGNGIAVAFRFRGITDPLKITETYMEFPELSSAGIMTVHVRCGNATAGTTLTLQKYESGAWTTMSSKTLTIRKSEAYQATSVDEVITVNINSKVPIKLRLCGGSKFVMLYRVDIESHYKEFLQTAINTANALKTANAGNVGNGLGQYSAEVNTTFTDAIAAAATVNSTSSATAEEVDAALETLNSAIAAFQASINKTDLQNLINTASTLQTDNISNVGTDVGQFPQTNYDVLVAAIPPASVVNTNAVATSSEIISAYTALNTIVNAFKTSGVPVAVSIASLSSNLSLTPASNISISDGGELIINENTEVNDITIQSGGKVTNSSTLHANSIIINSDASGTGTFVEGGAGSVLPATVNQYLTIGRNWYVSSPVKVPTIDAFQADSVVCYHEPTAKWLTQTIDSTLNPLKGYISVGTTGNIVYNGTLNTGDLQISLTRTEGVEKSGFNLIGNPYPSYINWTKALATTSNALTTIWYRTKVGEDYAFHTFNAEDGVASPEGTTGEIAPMQAFWVRVNNGGGTLYFNNSMRNHGTGSILLKAPAAQSSLHKLLRLQVTSGSKNDETVVYFNSNASDGFDSYDSPKMSNNKKEIPEIYTTAGNEQLVINGLNTLNLNKELPIGFNTKTSNTFSIKANEIRNFEADIRIILKDKVLDTEKDITNGTSYSFTSDVVNNSNRFCIIFKAASITTEINTNKSDRPTLNIFKNSNNQIAICDSRIVNAEGLITVCNSMGQKLITTHTTGTSTLLAKPFGSGVYLVSLVIDGTKTTRKLIIN